MNSTKEEEKNKRIEALRSRAERLLQSGRGETQAYLPEIDDIQGLIHELQVQHVELEMQNEELLESNSRTEHALQEYSRLYELAPVAYFTLDPYGVILRVNRAGCLLVGHASKILVGKLFRRFILPAHTSDFYEYITKACESDTKQVGEFQIIQKNEQVRYVRMEFLRVKNQGGQYECLVAVIDISDQKTAQEKLILEKEFSQNLLENSIDGIVAFDKHYCIIAWNKTMETLTGKSKNEVRGRNIFHLFPAYQVNEEGKAIVRALQGESTVLRDHPYGIKNGFFEVYTLPLLTDDPDKKGGLTIVHDVTERMKMEQERISLKLQAQKELLNAILQAQEEERKRIAEGLHNGLGQILYAAKLNLENIRIDAAQKDVEQTVKARQKAIDLLSEAIRETRSISHELVPVTLQDFGLEKAIADLSKRYTSHLPIHTEMYGLDQSLDKSTEVALYRIIQELINNIVKHAQASQVKLQLVRGEGRIVLKVSDNGKGFDPQIKSKGMGLRSIKDRVELLNGTIEIESAARSGASVLIIIPEI